MKKAILTTLFILALAERVLFDLGPNLELVTAFMLLSSAYATRRVSFWFTLALILITDLIIGNTNIFIFTWTGFLIPAIVFPLIFQTAKAKGVKKVFQGVYLGAGTSFFFFAWTNLGVWLLDSWGMYSNDFQGLMASYVNALPFWKNQLTSAVIFSGASFAIMEGASFLENRFYGSKKAAQKEYVFNN